MFFLSTCSSKSEITFPSAGLGRSRIRESRQFNLVAYFTYGVCHCKMTRTQSYKVCGLHTMLNLDMPTTISLLKNMYSQMVTSWFSSNNLACGWPFYFQQDGMHKMHFSIANFQTQVHTFMRLGKTLSNPRLYWECKDEMWYTIPDYLSCFVLQL